MPVPILIWRHAGMLFEECKKVILGGKSQVVADLLYGGVCAGQKMVYNLQFAVRDIGRERFAGVFLVYIPEIIYGQPHLFRKHDDGEVGVVNVFGDKALHLLDQFVLCTAVLLDLREGFEIIAAAVSELLLVFGEELRAAAQVIFGRQEGGEDIQAVCMLKLLQGVVKVQQVAADAVVFVPVYGVKKAV